MEKIKEYLKQWLKDFKKENFLQQAYAFGLEYEQTRTGCSQCVICALEKVLGLNYPDLVKASFPLCGGNLWWVNRRSIGHWLFVWEE